MRWEETIAIHYHLVQAGRGLRRQWLLIINDCINWQMKMLVEEEVEVHSVVPQLLWEAWPDENEESFCTNFKIIFLSSAFVSPHYDIHMMFCFTFMSILCRLHNVSIHKCLTKFELNTWAERWTDPFTVQDDQQLDWAVNCIGLVSVHVTVCFSVCFYGWCWCCCCSFWRVCCCFGVLKY